MTKRPSTARSDEIVHVDLGARSYDIHIGAGLLDRAGVLIKPLLGDGRVAIITDENVAKHFVQPLTASLDKAGIGHTLITLPPGEATKQFSMLEDVCTKLLDAKLERDDMVIALGGGVIGDLAGFAAAILRRGIDFIQVPTTLLAQVDSSVGGKTGINTAHGKNLVGAFHQPRLVLADIDTLDTLPERDFLSGYAEVVKYALIDDPKFFDWLEANGSALVSGDRHARVHAIVTACKAKARIVAQDEREQGCRALLNLGHTFGHALEAETDFSDRLTHGESVAIGLVMAHRFSQAQGLMSGQDCTRIENHFKAMSLKTILSDISGPALKPEALLDHMYQDKKVSKGQLTFILSEGIGKAFIAKNSASDQLLTFLTKQV